MAILTRPMHDPASVLAGERRALTIGLLLSVSAVAFEAMAVATVLPAAAEDLGGLGLYGWTFSAMMLASLVSTIVASQGADRRGPAVPYAAGMVLFACGLVVAGLAPAMPVFVGGRALQGAGAGALSAMSYVAISRGYPDALRARMLALLSSAWILPALLGPAVAGTVADHLHWRLVFLGLLPFVVLAATLMLPALRQMPAVVAPDLGPDRALPAVRLAVGTGLVLAGAGLHVPLAAAALMALGLALAVPALRRLMPPGTLTARPGLPAGLAVRGLLTYSFFGAEAFLPLGLTALRGSTTAQAGLALTATALTWTAASWAQARLDARDGGRGRRGRVLIGFVVILAGGILMAVAVTSRSLPLALAVAGWGIAGLGMGFAYPALSLIALRLAPEGQEGAVSGSLTVAETLSVAVGAGLGGAVIALGRSMDWAPRTGIAAAFALTLAGAVLGILAARRLPAGAAALDAAN